MCVCVCVYELSKLVEDIMSPSVKCHENRNHGLLNSEIKLGKSSSFSERNFGISHTYLLAVNLFFQGNVEC